MGKKEIQCLFIGESTKLYKDLRQELDNSSFNVQAKLVVAEKKPIIRALKKQPLVSLIFISDQTQYSLEKLSDIIWQFSPDSIVTIVTEKTGSTSLKTPFNNTQFSKLYFKPNNKNSLLHLQHLVQAVQLKGKFRRCKRLLGVAEKRCRWLVDSSNEPIAFISRDLHLYANTAYLGLFGINSINELPVVSVKELIINDEHELFNAFIKQQRRKQEINHSLILSLRKKNGGVFRANIHVIPSIFKGRKCLQLWVHPLSAYELDNEKTANHEGKEKLEFEAPNTSEILIPKKSSPASILKGIIKRKEAIITAQKLVSMKDNETRKNTSTISTHMLSLKVPIAQRVGIDNLLFESDGAQLQEKRQIFWDKVKLTRILQIILKKKNIDIDLLIRLSESSISNESFADWFLPGLKRLGLKANSITFLLPVQIDEVQIPLFMKFVKSLKSFGCQIALDDFSVSEESIRLLKYMKPEYVRLSLPWVRQIEGNTTRELALGSFIRQLEEKSIKVIAPCGFNKDMRKLFALSGASFCQERTLKTG